MVFGQARRALLGESLVKTGAGFPLVRNFERNRASGIPPTNNTAKKRLGKAEEIVKNKRGTTDKEVITFSSELILAYQNLNGGVFR